MPGVTIFSKTMYVWLLQLPQVKEYYLCSNDVNYLCFDVVNKQNPFSTKAEDVHGKKKGDSIFFN